MPKPAAAEKSADTEAEAEQARRSDLCGALELKAVEMMDLAEQAGYALRVTIDVYHGGSVAFVFH